MAVASAVFAPLLWEAFDVWRTVQVWPLVSVRLTIVRPEEVHAPPHTRASPAVTPVMMHWWEIAVAALQVTAWTKVGVEGPPDPPPAMRGPMNGADNPSATNRPRPMRLGQLCGRETAPRRLFIGEGVLFLPVRRHFEVCCCGAGDDKRIPASRQLR